MPTHDEFDDFFGDDDAPNTETTRADGRLLRVPLARLVPNLVNPRKDFGSEDDLIDFGKSLRRHQNQPCPVVSRSAYLKLWPDHADKIGSVDYVLVSGERRFRGATAVGMSALDCVVNDDVARDRKTFMEAVVSENVDRRNFDPIEEAYAVQALVTEFGSNRAVAQHFDRVDGWVTQRVLLTNLAREVQGLVRDKTIPLEAARQLGKLARDNDWGSRDQLAWWEEEQGRRAAAASARAAARKAAKQLAPAAPLSASAAAPEPPRSVSEAPPSFTAVKQPEAAEPAPAPEAAAVERPAIPEAREEPRSQPAPESEPDPDVGTFPIPASSPVEAAKAEHEPRRLPYDDPWFIAMHLDKKMTDQDFMKTVELLVVIAKDRDPEGLRSVLAAVLTPQAD